MTDAVGAEKGERTTARLSYRSGYYSRTLVTRVGKLELRAARMAAMTPSEREAYLERKPIPYVLRPGRQAYIVDHQSSGALWPLNIREAVLGGRRLVRSRAESILAHVGVPKAIAGRSTPTATATLRRHSRPDRKSHRERLAYTGRRVRGEGFDDLDPLFQEFMWGD
jgi:hypothetical protein